MHNTGLILDAESINDLKTLSIKAENVGFHSVWATELYRTSFQQIASTAQNTTKIRLGTAVSLAFTRSPLITALNSLDIDELSNGRFILGLGTGAKYTNENYHGIDYGEPVKRIKECVEIIKHFIASSHKNKSFEYNGDYYQHNTKGYKRAFKPLRDNIDIYLAGIGTNMIRTSAEIADGYIGHAVCSYKYLEDIVVPALNKGFEISGKNKENFKKCSIVTCAVSNNIEQAKKDVKATIGFYATVKTYKDPFILHGFENNLKEIRDAYFNNDIDKMIESVPDKMVDLFAIVGDKKYCLEKIEHYRKLIDLPILSVPHYFIDYKDVQQYQLRLIELFSQ